MRQDSPGPQSYGAHFPYRLALLFNANKNYDRGVIGGIASYTRSTRVDWDVFLEEDYRARLAGIGKWKGCGIIADFDDPTIGEALSTIKAPVVAVGSSYENEDEYPKNIPYVATDNRQLVNMALDHLISSGLTNFAMYSLPPSPTNRWAQERERAFARRVANGTVYQGIRTRAKDWDVGLKRLSEWLHSLAKPVGIIAITDARARHLLHACTIEGIAIPEEVAIVGIDNDSLTQSFSRIGLSSVEQGTTEMGRIAASWIHQMLQGVPLGCKRVIVPPSGITCSTSSRHNRLYSTHVMKALYYIRQHACQGIRTEQVAAFTGVSRSTLENSFKKELNATVHERMIAQRIDAAIELLQNTRLSTRSIAAQTGFSSVQYMHAAFVRETGVTPLQHRTEEHVRRQ